jgi:hypothetical protein
MIKGHAGKIRANPVFWVMTLIFAFSLAAFFRYVTGADLPDENLYKLLAILKVSSFLICVCSLYLVIVSIGQMISLPCAWAFLKIILFLCAALYGAGIIVLTFFIIVISGGNS